MWWYGPDEDWIKINMDATIFRENMAAGVGIVTRIIQGHFQWAATLRFIHEKAFVVEGLALRLAMVIASKLEIC